MRKKDGDPGGPIESTSNLPAQPIHPYLSVIGSFFLFFF